jgi:hypothetical protein
MTTMTRLPIREVVASGPGAEVLVDRCPLERGEAEMDTGFFATAPALRSINKRSREVSAMRRIPRWQGRGRRGIVPFGRCFSPPAEYVSRCGPLILIVGPGMRLAS